MNNEREMLELAAKAAGIEIETGIYFYDAGFKVTGTATYWNPILSDADALRLAVKSSSFWILTDLCYQVGCITRPSTQLSCLILNPRGMTILR